MALKALKSKHGQACYSSFNNPTPRRSILIIFLLCLPPPIEKTSARQPARMKYKIEKKVREHKRKIKKAAKKSGAHKKGPKQKMIQVPNICPFKEDIIKEAEAVRQHNDEEKAKRREQARLERLAKPKGQSLESIVVSAQTRGALHTAINESRGPASTDDYMCEERSKENSLKAYFKEFKKVGRDCKSIRLINRLIDEN